MAAWFEKTRVCTDNVVVKRKFDNEWKEIELLRQAVAKTRKRES